VSIDSSARALLDLVETERGRRCEEIRARARTEAASVIAQAHADARAAMRRTFAEARERRMSRIAAANADLATRARIAEQHRLAALLADAWKGLPAALAARWRDPPSRRRWVDYVASLARNRLPRGAWRIVHAPDWPAPERDALAAALDAPPTFTADSGHRAGLAIACSSNVIDGTLEGLLADRDDIGAQLLLEVQQPDTAARVDL
jgi:hypothetical protein